MATSDTLLRQAREKWLADDHKASLSAFRAAMTARPDDFRLAVETASYLGMRFEVAEASEILRRCEERLAGNAEGLHQVGLAYARAYRPDDSLRCYRNVVQFAPQHVPSWIRIAEWHERRGDVPAAWESMVQCGELDPSGEIRLWRGKLLRRMNRPAAARSTLVSLTDDVAAPTQVRSDAWYELAGLHDQHDEADEAFAAAMAAKRLQQPQLASHVRAAQSLARLEANFVSTVAQDDFQRWQQTAKHAPLALLTGSPRSGTTLMARMLGMHPGLTLADEVNVYPTYVHREMLSGKRGASAADVLQSLDETHLASCRNRYRQWMAAATATNDEAGCLLDKNPSTTFLVPAFRRLFPQAVIVMPLRDPRDVVVSCFLRNLPLNPVSAMFSQLDWTVMRCHAEWTAWRQLREKLTPPWFEVRYEDVASGRRHALGRVLDSLGLVWSDDFASFQSSLHDQPVRSSTYAQLFAPVSTRSIGRWQLYRRHLEPYLSRLDGVAREFGYKASSR